jgi:multidrug efflux pump subunit AcrA (membrane-fusion protein)
VTTALPTEPKVRQAEAQYNQALSEMARLDAIINDYIIKAPFSGMVSEVSMKLGEAASSQHTVTVINAGDYLVKSLVPEIKIVDVEVGQASEVYFDAAPNELIVGEVAFVSPVSKNIGGVSYYETHVSLINTPDWIREGLNADIEIIIDKKEDVPKVPNRYIISENEDRWVLEVAGSESVRRKIDIGLIGSDDMVEVFGIDIGSKLILP